MEVEAVLAEQAAFGARHASSPPASSAVPGLMLRCTTEPTAPIPALFEPVFYVVLQGAKRLTFAGQTHDFATGTCAVATVGLPFISQVIGASPARPYVGAELRLDPGVIADLQLTLPDVAARDVPSFAAAPADATMLEPFGRLLRLLATPADRARAMLPVASGAAGRHASPSRTARLTFCPGPGCCGLDWRQCGQASQRHTSRRRSRNERDVPSPSLQGGDRLQPARLPALLAAA